MAKNVAELKAEIRKEILAEVEIMLSGSKALLSRLVELHNLGTETGLDKDGAHKKGFTTEELSGRRKR